MHVSEGVLTAPVLILGGLGAIGGVFIGLKKIQYEDVPKVAVLSSAFFVVSLVQIPFGASSVHLVLNGFLGILLGWRVFPSILVALSLQALLFQFGGFTTLGVNTLNMSLPALACFFIFAPLAGATKKWKVVVAGMGAGIFSILAASLLMALELFFSNGNLLNVCRLVFVSHIPLMVIEGLVTTFCLLFLKKANFKIREVAR